MASRYQHITAPVQRDVARRISGLLWQSDDAGQDDPDDDGEGGAGALGPA